MTSTAQHYEVLFSEIRKKYGPLDGETLTAIVGFGAGGPVSLSKIERENIYVTCELSLYPEQHLSTDGLRFELLSLGSFDRDVCQAVLTAVGRLSMNAKLGHGHTVDVGGVVSGGPTVVRIQQFSKSTIGDKRFGIYQVVSFK